MRDDFEGINIQPAVGLVKNGKARFEHRHLQNLTAFLFATGKSFIDRAGSERPVDVEQAHLLVKLGVVVGGLQFFTFWQTGLRRRAQEISDGDTRNFTRILKGEKQTSSRALVRPELKEVFAIHQHSPARHAIVRIAGNDLCQRAFARAVWTHDGMHFACPNGEAEIADDLALPNRNAQIVDLQLLHESNLKHIQNWQLGEGLNDDFTLVASG